MLKRMPLRARRVTPHPEYSGAAIDGAGQELEIHAIGSRGNGFAVEASPRRVFS